MSTCFKRLAISLLISAAPAFADIPCFDVFSEESKSLDNFVAIKKQSRSSIVTDAAKSAVAAYNSHDLVGMSSKPIRTQMGNTARQALVNDGQQVIGFSATTSGYGSVPAGIVTLKKDDSGKSTITVSFHGTESVADLLTDAWSWKKDGTDLGINGCVHGGFYNRYMQSREALFAAINGALDANGLDITHTEILCTGHSLGAALATLAAADIKAHSELGSVNLITFNSPRVLDHKAATSFENTLGGTVQRVWRAGDPISTVSLGTTIFGWITGFKHVGQSTKLSAEGDTVFSMKNHSMGAMLRDAVSASPVKVLEHEGLRTKASRVMSSVTSFITKPVRSFFGW